MYNEMNINSSTNNGLDRKVVVFKYFSISISKKQSEWKFQPIFEQWNINKIIRCFVRCYTMIIRISGMHNRSHREYSSSSNTFPHMLHTLWRILHIWHTIFKIFWVGRICRTRWSWISEHSSVEALHYRTSYYCRR